MRWGSPRNAGVIRPSSAHAVPSVWSRKVQKGFSQGCSNFSGLCLAFEEDVRRWCIHPAGSSTLRKILKLPKQLFIECRVSSELIWAMRGFVQGDSDRPLGRLLGDAAAK